MGTQMSVETGAKSAIPLRCAPNSQPFRNCSSDKSDSFAEAEAYRSFYRKLAQRHFNPRAPEGCNTAQATTRRSLSSFNPRAPRGTRLAVRHMFVALPPFQPTRPARGATVVDPPVRHLVGVSTHAPREGRDDSASGHATSSTVSTHAPREGHDHNRPLLTYKTDAVSTHAPREGRDFPGECVGRYGIVVSTHAPREGRDKLAAMARMRPDGFNPRAPRGARRVRISH